MHMLGRWHLPQLSSAGWINEWINEGLKERKKKRIENIGRHEECHKGHGKRWMNLNV